MQLELRVKTLGIVLCGILSASCFSPGDVVEASETEAQTEGSEGGDGGTTGGDGDSSGTSGSQSPDASESVSGGQDCGVAEFGVSRFDEACFG